MVYEDDRMIDDETVFEDETAATDRAAALMEDRVGVSVPGWRWHAIPVADAPGWFRVWQHGPDARNILRGGVTFLGPGDVVLTLSSNPLIHDFSHTEDVLAELGGTGASAAELRTEIAKRTRTRY